MQDFKVTSDRRVYVDGVEIKKVTSFSIIVDGGDDPEVVLRVRADRVSIDGFSAFGADIRQKEWQI